MKTFYFLTTLVCLLLGTSSYAQYIKLLNFEGLTNGSNPLGSLISDGTFLYGTTYYGGTNDMGTAFKIKPDGTNYVKLVDFDGVTNGSHPYSSFVLVDNFLYGTTHFGGANGVGTIFKMKPDGTDYEILLDFDGPTKGRLPVGTLVSDGTFLYGMTWRGGTSDMGVIYKIMPDGTGYEKLLDFEGATTGREPFGSLILDGTVLYGITLYGGTNDMGITFKINSDGTSYLKLMDFDNVTNGSYPHGTLISDGTFLYGMTQVGGANDMGTLYKITPNGTDYERLIDFAGLTNGKFPTGGLVTDGTFLYGTTAEGGASDIGTVYKIKPDGSSYTKLTDFVDSTDGVNPIGTLVSEGVFLYGMTVSGGTNGKGVIFKLSSTVGVDEINKESKLTVYPNPTTGIINISATTSDVQSVSVTNVLGEVVLNREIEFNNKTTTIDISEQPAGIYFLKLGDSIERIIRH